MASACQPSSGKFARLLGHHRNRGVARVGRQRDDLVGIGERDHQLIGADIERRDAARRIGGGRRTTAAEREARQRDNATSEIRNGINPPDGDSAANPLEGKPEACRKGAGGHR